MEYLISQTEIVRRKKAYATLSVSIIIGLVVASIILRSPISVTGYASIAAFIILVGVISFRFFHKLSKIKIHLFTQSLERVVDGVVEEYTLNKVKRVRIKWTTNSTIREVYIWLSDGKRVFVTALDHFDEFKKDLLGKLNTNTAVEEIHEPLDFDHPLFYSLLGLPISFLGVFIFKSATSPSHQQIKNWLIVFSVYLFVFGVYFIVAKPISKRSGNTSVVVDYSFGLFMICSAIIFFFMSK